MKKVLYIGNHLSRSGSNPSVAESIAPRLLPDIELRLVSRHRNIFLRFGEMCWAIWRHGRREQPVVIDVFSTLNFYYAAGAGLLCRLLRLPYICVLHGGNLPERLQRSPRLCRRLFGGARTLAAPSPYLQEAFQRAGYPVQLIPNPVDIEACTFRFRQQVRPRLLWVRAFEATYNPGMAIEVLHRLSEVYTEAELCMVGPDKDGSMETCRQLARELGVSERVRFSGRLSKAEWFALSNDYDIFINTTHFDNMPVSVIEAMALGLPVVSTDAGGLPYLIESGRDGLLVDKGDVAGMCAAIVRLLTEEGLAPGLAVKARVKAEGFDVPVVLEQWRRILRT